MQVDRRFWLNHVFWPLLLFIPLATMAATTSLDESIARAWAFDAKLGRFIGTGPGAWWARELIHGAGGKVMRALGVLILLFWVATFATDAWGLWRRPAGFLILSIALGTGTVSLLKETTNVDCPQALAGFGGQRPYVHLLAARPPALPHARCFPGGHSSSGFALFSLYFLYLGRSRRLARASLALALVVGGAFAFGQEARGSHFLSHDVWSAAIVWFACLSTYTFAYKGNVWDTVASRCAVGPVPDTPA